MKPRKSRYLKLPAAVTIDSRGRSVSAVSPRMLPTVSGTFLHTIEDGDRLDHLAFKYYRQPTRWWRICDANPDFMSPDALLGKDPFLTLFIPLHPRREVPAWHSLLKRLSGLVGVEEVEIVDDIRLVERTFEHDGHGSGYLGEHPDRGVIICYNRLNLSRKAVIHEITSAGFNIGDPRELGRVGKRIVIPPDDPA